MFYSFVMLSDAWMKYYVPTSKSVEGLNIQTMNLHEELAEIEYLLCDKTGTLTRNYLEFRALAIVKEKDTNKLSSPDKI